MFQVSGGCSKPIQTEGKRGEIIASQRHFLDFYTKKDTSTDDHLGKVFFIEILKERHEISERTPSVSLCPWTLAYSRDRT